MNSVLKSSLPWGSMLKKKKTNGQKFKKNTKSKQKKITQGTPQLKFGSNLCNYVRDNRCHRRTDDGRTTDEFRFHELCWHSQSELTKCSRDRMEGPQLYSRMIRGECTSNCAWQCVITINHRYSWNIQLHRYIRPWMTLKDQCKVTGTNVLLSLKGPKW